ncbi:UNKNOWN [Stylonychia lemnae]|uniref:Uncharacterized protein n=1 Tax=Stylonychia lemnae TaxID=5949 RepID=A0A078A449_STYLE|nr:UNKNOWN [Stylonychia lemnae]|eukprot:CDW76303.1 UNKNOWN [Stylonychia lemnae]
MDITDQFKGQSHSSCKTKVTRLDFYHPIEMALLRVGKIQSKYLILEIMEYAMQKDNYHTLYQANVNLRRLFVRNMIFLRKIYDQGYSKPNTIAAEFQSYYFKRTFFDQVNQRISDQHSENVKFNILFYEHINMLPIFYFEEFKQIKWQRVKKVILRLTNNNFQIREQIYTNKPVYNIDGGLNQFFKRLDSDLNSLICYNMSIRNKWT